MRLSFIDADIRAVSFVLIVTYKIDPLDIVFDIGLEIKGSDRSSLSIISVTLFRDSPVHKRFILERVACVST